MIEFKFKTSITAVILRSDLLIDTTIQQIEFPGFEVNV